MPPSIMPGKLHSRARLLVVGLALESSSSLTIQSANSCFLARVLQTEIHSHLLEPLGWLSIRQDRCCSLGDCFSTQMLCTWHLAPNWFELPGKAMLLIVILNSCFHSRSGSATRTRRWSLIPRFQVVRDSTQWIAHLRERVRWTRMSASQWEATG